MKKIEFSLIAAVVICFSVATSIMALNNSENETLNQTEEIIVNLSLDTETNEKSEIVNPYAKTPPAVKHNSMEISLDKGISTNNVQKLNDISIEKTHVLVQFNRKLNSKDKKLLSGEGIKLVKHISDNNYYAAFSDKFDNILEINNNSEIILKSKTLNDPFLIRSITNIDKNLKMTKELQNENFKPLLSF